MYVDRPMHFAPFHPGRSSSLRGRGLGDDGGGGPEVTIQIDGKYLPAIGFVGPALPGQTISYVTTPSDAARIQGIIAAADNAAQSAQLAAAAYQQQQAAQALRDLQAAQQAALAAVQIHQATIMPAPGPATAQPVTPTSTSGDAAALAAANQAVAAAQAQAAAALKQAQQAVQAAQQAAAAATTQAQANAAQAALYVAQAHQAQVVDAVQSQGLSTGAIPLGDLAGEAGGGTLINYGTTAGAVGVQTALGQVPPLYLYAGAALAAILLLRR